MTDLKQKRCVPCEGGVAPLTREASQALMQQLAGNWRLAVDAKEIRAEFSFSDFDRSMAFVNAVAWVAHEQDHHPDVCFGYNYVHISYSTHAIKGLSENDFICAARVDALLTD